LAPGEIQTVFLSLPVSVRSCSTLVGLHHSAIAKSNLIQVKMWFEVGLRAQTTVKCPGFQRNPLCVTLMPSIRASGWTLTLLVSVFVFSNACQENIQCIAEM